MDHYLNRWLQPDSIIPDPHDPQSWDRYSFVRNNPVNRIDSNGHRDCEDSDGTNCGFMEPKTLAVVNNLLNTYGVTMTGTWTVSEGYAAYVATYLAGESLRPYTHTGGVSAFNKGFGPIVYNSSNDLGGWYGIGNDGTISVLAGQVTYRLVLHELGHSFEKHIWARDGGMYKGTDNPIQMLVDNGVYDVNNNLVTGKGNRNNDMNAPDNGYWSDDIPDQYHPRSMEDGDNTNEDWADMFLNWVDKSFYPNPAGNALNNWITTNMSEWIH
jgi:hypothetical protein